MSDAGRDWVPFGDDLDLALRRLLEETSTDGERRFRRHPINADVPAERLSGFELELWVQTPPAAIAYVPATTVPSCIGRRLVRVLNGGWKEDFRAASNPYPHPRTAVLGLDVLQERDWYLRSFDPSLSPEAFFVPLDALDVETPVDISSATSAERTPTQEWLRRVEVLTRTRVPIREPRRVRDVPWLPGHRLVLAHPDGPIRDVRAVSEPSRASDGEIVVSYLPEAEWYLWEYKRTRPTSYSVEYVWVE